MKIDSIEVGNFRNYEKEKIEFHDRTNIIYGDNAQGKTNILEAAFVCSTSKSHRGSRDAELIKIGSEEAHIRMFFQKKGVRHRIDVHLRLNKPKGIAIDGVPIKRSSELIGFVNIIVFSPEDLKIVKNGPSERRKFINFELSKIDGIYLRELGEYNKALLQRNRLLKQICREPSLEEVLGVWDEKLVEFGSSIISSRKKFIERLSDAVRTTNERLTGNKDHVSLVYMPDASEETFARDLMMARERDLKFYTTSVGPHRDDLCFMNDDVDVRKYGSQGQQRTCALSLKLAEIELVKEMINDAPVLLLDDVLSELDRSRQNYVLDSLGGMQAIVTCTGLEEFIGRKAALDRVFKVRSGKIYVEKG